MLEAIVYSTFLGEKETNRELWNQSSLVYKIEAKYDKVAAELFNQMVCVHFQETISGEFEFIYLI